MKSLTEILTICLGKSDELRITAEAEIDKWAFADFGKLLFDLGTLLQDETGQVQIRQLCATMIKNLTTKSEKHKGRWFEVNPETRNVVKNQVLSCLASGVKEVRRASSNTVAGIFNF